MSGLNDEQTGTRRRSVSMKQNESDLVGKRVRHKEDDPSYVGLVLGPHERLMGLYWVSWTALLFPEVRDFRGLHKAHELEVIDECSPS